MGLAKKFFTVYYLKIKLNAEITKIVFLGKPVLLLQDNGVREILPQAEVRPRLRFRAQLNIC